MDLTIVKSFPQWAWIAPAASACAWSMMRAFTWLQPRRALTHPLEWLFLKTQYGFHCTTRDAHGQFAIYGPQMVSWWPWIMITVGATGPELWFYTPWAMLAYGHAFEAFKRQHHCFEYTLFAQSHDHDAEFAPRDAIFWAHVLFGQQPISTTKLFMECFRPFPSPTKNDNDQSPCNQLGAIVMFDRVCHRAHVYSPGHESMYLDHGISCIAPTTNISSKNTATIFDQPKETAGDIILGRRWTLYVHKQSAIFRAWLDLYETCRKLTTRMQYDRVSSNTFPPELFRRYTNKCVFCADEETDSWIVRLTDYFDYVITLDRAPTSLRRYFIGRYANATYVTLKKCTEPGSRDQLVTRFERASRDDKRVAPRTFLQSPIVDDMLVRIQCRISSDPDQLRIEHDFGETRPICFLISGLPGNGKTCIAETFSVRSKLSLLWVMQSDLQTRDDFAAFREMLEGKSEQDCILAFDEFVVPDESDEMYDQWIALCDRAPVVAIVFLVRHGSSFVDSNPLARNGRVHRYATSPPTPDDAMHIICSRFPEIDRVQLRTALRPFGTFADITSLVQCCETADDVFAQIEKS